MNFFRWNDQSASMPPSDGCHRDVEQFRQHGGSVQLARVVGEIREMAEHFPEFRLTQDPQTASLRLPAKRRLNQLILFPQRKFLRADDQ
jgi:hypothetical protein